MCFVEEAREAEGRQTDGNCFSAPCPPGTKEGLSRGQAGTSATSSPPPSHPSHRNSQGCLIPSGIKGLFLLPHLGGGPDFPQQLREKDHRNKPVDETHIAAKKDMSLANSFPSLAKYNKIPNLRGHVLLIIRKAKGTHSCAVDQPCSLTPRLQESRSGKPSHPQGSCKSQAPALCLILAPPRERENRCSCGRAGLAHHL